MLMYACSTHVSRLSPFNIHLHDDLGNNGAGILFSLVEWIERLWGANERADRTFVLL